MAKNGYEQVQNIPQKPAVISWESLRSLILSAQNESGRVFILKDTYLKGAERFTYISFKKEGDGIKVSTIDTHGTVSTYSYVDFIQELKHTFGNYTYQGLTFQEQLVQEKARKEGKVVEPPQAVEDLYPKDKFIVESEEKRPLKKPASVKHVENVELTEKLNALVSEIKNDLIPEGEDRGYWKNDENAIKLIQLYREAYRGYGFFDEVHKKLVELGYTAENGTEIVNGPGFRGQASPGRINSARTKTRKTPREKTPRRSKMNALDIPEVREAFEQQQRRREEERRAGIHHRQFEHDDGARMLIMIAKKHVGKYWASQSAKMLNKLGFVTRNGNEIKSLTLNQWLDRKKPKRSLVKKQPLTPVYAPSRPPKPSQAEQAHNLRMQRNRVQGRIDAIREREIKQIRKAKQVKGKESRERLEATLSTFNSIIEDVTTIVREKNINEKNHPYKRPIKRIEFSATSIKTAEDTFTMVPTITIAIGPLTDESVAHRATREMCEYLETHEAFLSEPPEKGSVAKIVINWVGKLHSKEKIATGVGFYGGFPILERYIQIPGLKNETITIPQGTY